MSEVLDDEYVRRTARWIRTNEVRLAAVRTPKSNALNPLSWMTGPQDPVTLSLTRSQLSYLLTRIEGVGIPVGSMDVTIANPRPTQLLPIKDRSDTQSISSFVSHLSLSPASWFTKPNSIEAEIKYIYSSFTKMPALQLTNPPSREPERLALPVDAFKNVQVLKLEDIDPRSLIGWDRLAESLRSLVVKRSGIEDVTQLIVDVVDDDETRRANGDIAPITRRSASRRSSQVCSRQPSWHSSIRRADIIAEETEPSIPNSSPPSDAPLSLPALPESKWWCLRHLSLADNSLTFFPTEALPYLTSLMHLDLSNNLLISVPMGLGDLHRLVSLDLSGNMIESVLGIYTLLGQIHTLNLSSNRIDSLCGLERLGGLTRVDLRHNHLYESGEVGRLATLPHISEVWINGNPLVSQEPDWRVKCFAYFQKERKSITLDGLGPGYLERSRVDAIVGSPPAEAVMVVTSPKTGPVKSNVHSRTASVAGPSPGLNPINGVVPTQPSSGSASPSVAPTSPPSTYGAATIHAHPKSKRRKQPRIVDLDLDDPNGSPPDRSPQPKAHDLPTPTVNAPFTASPVFATFPTDKPGPLANPETSSLALSPPSADRMAASPSVPVALSAGTSIPPMSSRAYMSATLGRHAPNGSSGGFGEDDFLGALPLSTSPGGRRRQVPSASATFTSSMSPASRGSKRRARVSASVFEPSGPSPGSSPRQGSLLRSGNGEAAPQADLQFASEAEAFRAKIEALRNEVGDSWLKVLSQSNNLSMSPPSGVNSGAST